MDIVVKLIKCEFEIFIVIVMNKFCFDIVDELGLLVKIVFNVFIVIK